MFYAIKNKHKIWFTLSKLIITDKEYNNLSDNNKSAYENLPECPKWLTSFLNVKVNQDLNNEVIEIETAKKLMEFGISTPTRPKRYSPSGSYASFKPKHQVLEQVPVPEQLQEDDSDFNPEDEEYQEEEQDEEHHDEEELDFELPLIELSNENESQASSSVATGQVIYGSGSSYLKHYTSTIQEDYTPRFETKAQQEEPLYDSIRPNAWMPQKDKEGLNAMEQLGQALEKISLNEYEKSMIAAFTRGTISGSSTKSNKI